MYARDHILYSIENSNISIKNMIDLNSMNILIFEWYRMIINEREIKSHISKIEKILKMIRIEF